MLMVLDRVWLAVLQGIILTVVKFCLLSIQELCLGKAVLSAVFAELAMGRLLQSRMPIILVTLQARKRLAGSQVLMITATR